MVNIRKVQHSDENNLAYIQTESWKEAFKDIVPADLLSKYNGIERATAMCVQSDFMKNMASRRAEESSLRLARLRRCICAGCDMGINKSKVVEVPMSRKVRLCAIIVFIIALIISIIRILIDFNYGIERISPLIPVLDIASAIVWVICIVVNCVLYQKKDR